MAKQLSTDTIKEMLLTPFNVFYYTDPMTWEVTPITYGELWDEYQRRTN